MHVNEWSDPEVIWDHLLSRQPERIKDVFRRLSSQEQRAVLAHLQRMANEPGWHPEQCVSAQAALEALSVGFD